MFIDITLQIDEGIKKAAGENEAKVSYGHMGTHFDVMNKEFPIEYLEREAVVFDVSGVRDRDIGPEDIEAGLIGADMFVAFYTGFIEKIGYGSKVYFTEHPQLSDALIDLLLDKKVSIIGIDWPGARRGKEHTKKDQYCADRGTFIVENLCNLDQVLNKKKTAGFVANTYPISFKGLTGVPCRVVARL